MVILMKYLKKLLHKQFKNSTGYSLVELSVSTSVIAILAVGGLAVMQKKTNASRISETKNKIATIESALKSFIKINGYLPCPASPRLVETNINFGRSQNLTLDAISGVTSDTMYDDVSEECSQNGLATFNNTGMVPVRTLKLNSDYAYDGWQRKFTYRIATSAGSKEDFADESFRGDIRIVDLYGNNKTNIDNSPPFNDGALYVVISHGQNGKDVAWRKNFDYITNSAASELPIEATGVERQNTSHSIASYIQDEETSRFDDIVAYGSQNIIIPPKIVESPIIIDEDICSGASSIAQKESILEDYADINDSTKAFSEKLSEASRKIDFLCANTASSINGKINPLNSSGLILWLDATDSQGRKKELTDNAQVSFWFDKSGNGNDAISSGSARPIYETSAINSKPAIKFDGMNDFMKIESEFKVVSNDSVSLFIVVKPEVFSSQGQEERVIFASDNSYGWNFRLSNTSEEPSVFGIYNSQSWVYRSSSNTIAIPNVKLPEALIFSYKRKISGSTAIESLKLNGKSVGYASNNNANLNYKVDDIRLIGKSAGRADSLKGHIGEMLIYNRHVSDKVSEGIESNLSDKWNIKTTTTLTDNKCPYEGQVFRTTANDPKGGCHCPDGQSVLFSMDNIDACKLGSNVFGKCVPYMSRPDYESNNLAVPNLPGMVLWLDANDCTTIKLKSDRTASSSKYVEQWLDKSPAKNHFENKDDDIATNPVYTVNNNSGLFKARSYISFKNNYLKANNYDALNFAGKNALTVFAVVKPNSFNEAISPIIGRVSDHNYSNLGWSLSTLARFSTTGTSYGGNSYHQVNGYNFSLKSNKGVVNQYTKSHLSVHSPYLVTAIYNSDVNNIINVHLNGLDDSISNLPNVPETISTAGSHAYIGKTGKSDSYFNGDIAELLVFESALNDVQISKITDKYLLPKWGISKSTIAYPANISEGLKLWLDGSDSSTMFSNNTCSIAVNSSTPNLKCWKSKVNDYKAITISSKSPTVEFLNNKNKVIFNNNALSISNSYSILDTSTIFAVVSSLKPNSTSVFLDNIGNDSYYAFGHTLNMPLMISNYQLVKSIASSSSSQINYGELMIVAMDNSEQNIYKNGKLLNVKLQNYGSNNNNPVTVIGSDSKGSFNWSGEINELIIYDRKLESDEIIALHGALSDKWDVELEGEEIEVPQTISGLKLWLDAADYDGDGDISNNPSSYLYIDEWKNKATVGGNAVQTNSSLKPKLRANQQNSLPTIWFDGLNHSMKVDNYNEINLNQNFTLTTVFRAENNYISSLPGSYNYPAIISKILSTNEKQYLLTVSNPMRASFISEKGNSDFILQSPSSTLQTNKYYINTVTIGEVIAGKSRVTMYQNGQEQNSQAALVPQKSDMPLIIGDWGGNSLSVKLHDNGVNFKGYIGEVIIYDKALDFNDRYVLEKHLGEKWGIAVTH